MALNSWDSLSAGIKTLIDDARMKKECDVNAVWNAALNCAYPFPLYTVAPEATPEDDVGDKGTVDLLVRHAITRAPWVFYEGKSLTGDTLLLAQTQLVGYTKEAKVKQGVWGIAAKSTTVRFFWVDFALGFPRCFPLRVESHVVLRGKADGEQIDLKLSNDEQRQKAITILQFMAANDPTKKPFET